MNRPIDLFINASSFPTSTVNSCTALLERIQLLAGQVRLIHLFTGTDRLDLAKWSQALTGKNFRIHPSVCPSTELGMRLVEDWAADKADIYVVNSRNLSTLFDGYNGIRVVCLNERNHLEVV